MVFVDPARKLSSPNSKLLGLLQAPATFDDLSDAFVGWNGAAKEAAKRFLGVLSETLHLERLGSQGFPTYKTVGRCF